MTLTKKIETASINLYGLVFNLLLGIRTRNMDLRLTYGAVESKSISPTGLNKMQNRLLFILEAICAEEKMIWRRIENIYMYVGHISESHILKFVAMLVFIPILQISYLIGKTFILINERVRLYFGFRYPVQEVKNDGF